MTGAYAETIPFFEVLTLVVFCSGVLLGVRDGVLVGVVSELMYTTLNPYGPAPPLITLSQVVGMAVPGATGGVLGIAGIERLSILKRATALGITGAALTLFFDLVTNLASGILVGQLRVILIGGIPFSLLHTGTNVVLFAAIGTPLTGALSRYRSRLSY